MTNADLRVKEEVEVDPVNQNRNQQKNLLPPKPESTAGWRRLEKYPNNATKNIICVAIGTLKKAA